MNRQSTRDPRQHAGSPRSIGDGAALRAAAAGGSPEHFDLLVERYGDRIAGYVLRRTGDRHRADDLTQEVFLRVFRAARDAAAPEREDLAPWIFRIASNCVTDYLRACGRRPLRLEGELDDPLPAVADHRFDPVSQTLREETTQHLASILARLPFEQSETVVLKVCVGLTLGQIAESMNATLPAVKSRLRYGLLRLQSILPASKEEHT